MRELLAITFTLALVLAVALVGTQLLLPQIVEGQLEGAMARLMPEHEEIKVHVGSFPAFRMLGGKIASVAIDVKEPVLAGLQVSWFAVRGEQVQVDSAALLRGKLELQHAEELALEVALSEEELSGYVAQQLPQVGSVSVALQPGVLQVRGAVTVLGQSIEASARGQLIPSGPSGIRFLPEEIAVEGERLPEFLLPAIGSVLEWELNLGVLPFPVRIDSIKVTEEYVVIRGVWASAEPLE